MINRHRTGTEYVPGLDGIRALAIGLVLLSHHVIYDEFTRFRSFGLEGGFTGVAIFFVLSGYLITNLLLREEERTGGISLRAFYARRALRLFPALWLYLGVVGVLWLAGLLPGHPWHSFVTSLIYIRNLIGHGHETDHLWSLSIEEQFYLLWPLSLIALRRNNRARLAVALAAIAAIGTWRVYAAHAGLASAGALYIRSDFRFDAPLFGCATALLLRVAPGTLSWANCTPRRSALAALAGAAGLAAWVVFRLGDRLYAGTGDIVVCLIGVALILSQTGTTARTNWLAWRPLVTIGQISYGIYLWQQLFLGPHVPGLTLVRTFPIGLVAIFTASGLSYRYVEAPLLKLKDRLQFPPRVSAPEHAHPAADFVEA